MITILTFCNVQPTSTTAIYVRPPLLLGAIQGYTTVEGVLGYFSALQTMKI